ncbi:hypothetical protein [Tenacibaculum piscium]|uniref:hypothetical protein n=1 Tax=Tenacibaculum piscium TaxID=1458515 RepID=UPI001F1D67FC|nr:hypothetical protein [Tenacibaculum piscium]
MDKELKHTLDFKNQKISNKAGFSIPENYFQTIDATILNKINQKKVTEIKKVKNNKDEIEENNKVEKNKDNKIIYLSQNLYKKTPSFITLIAAASVVVFIGFYYLNTTKAHYSLDDITPADISFWYENGYGTTNNNELAIMLESSTIDERDILSSINDENLEDYLNMSNDATFLNEN